MFRSFQIVPALLAFLCSLSFEVLGQSISLEYYFPNHEWNDEIPSPGQILGFEVGEWHMNHDKLLRYATELADASDRVTLVKYGRSHEQRDLFYLLVCRPELRNNLDEIKRNRKAWLKGKSAKGKEQPVILYQGYSIHGDEPSGSNASMLYAYWLAASDDAAVDELLENTIILIDPTFNPDGFTRFANWANSNKSTRTMPVDPSDREHHAPWPGGRTNHFYFDLNRDWLPVQHPESQGRISVFREWMPNILTDHHEMGSNSTFFFQPGIPSRTNPLTPARNQELTAEMAKYHGMELDKIGSLYYTRESFDDFYYGKGSTYPDVNGCIGILFEQAGVEGHQVETVNGILTFAFGIRNQLTTSISTLKGAHALRNDLLSYQEAFYSNSRNLQKEEKAKGYLVGSAFDKSRLKAFTDILEIHEIEFKWLRDDHKGENGEYLKDYSIFIPYEQLHYRVIKGMFQVEKSFKDSLFYDVSAWTLPLAFNMQFEEITSISGLDLTDQKPDNATSIDIISEEPYAVVFEWDDYFSPSLLYELQSNHINCRVIKEPIVSTSAKGVINIRRGSILINGSDLHMQPDNWVELATSIASKYNIELIELKKGLSEEGRDLGSPKIDPLEIPKIVLITGNGVSGYDAGEIWHLLDHRMRIPVSRIDQDRINEGVLKNYNVLVMADGSYGRLSENDVQVISNWVSNGGVLITMRNAINWAKGVGLSSLITNGSKIRSRIPDGPRAYARRSADQGASRVGGSIVKAVADLTHPLLFGYHEEEVPLFKRGTNVYRTSSNEYSNPLRYSENALLAGYLPNGFEEGLAGTTALTVDRLGSGRIIHFVDNPNFRGFWYGTNKLFMNAIFFGHQIDSGACNSVSGYRSGN